MRAIRRRHRSVVINIDALLTFLEVFQPEAMIPALVKLCDFAVTHPDYDAEFPNEDLWLTADIATDILADLFYDDYEAPEELDAAPTVTVNARRGTITIRTPSLERESRSPEHPGSSSPSPTLPPSPAETASEVERLDPSDSGILPLSELPPAGPHGRVVWRRPRRYRPPG